MPEESAPRCGNWRRVHLGWLGLLGLLVVVKASLDSSMLQRIRRAIHQPRTHTGYNLSTNANVTSLSGTASDPRRLAYMLYATDARTVCNALLMARNIRETGTPVSIPIVTLVASDVAPDVANHLVDTANNFVVERVAPWKQSGVEWSHEYAMSLTKLRIFEERGSFLPRFLQRRAVLHLVALLGY
ncbi:hypothetical protein H310_10630 [Aphanomyces invadans]|uniref:Uncharacterized protein n=1 Tax=Aphanomyces invadans TaxID=157072 RepID=A0A024TPR0_9STRA|nr:hypothetical protein H310_10630 [Aphanomyces invadans]ETV95974.1 hypothetical protein H310_10630 [Aphanomyces invadans]|eukprot:XP_008875285.1 hypothetical protein H310_10630 [Aphanomyces invadans]